jgi:hypothetical protein
VDQIGSRHLESRNHPLPTFALSHTHYPQPVVVDDDDDDDDDVVVVVVVVVSECTHQMYACFLASYTLHTAHTLKKSKHAGCSPTHTHMYKTERNRQDIYMKNMIALSILIPRLSNRIATEAWQKSRSYSSI